MFKGQFIIIEKRRPARFSGNEKTVGKRKNKLNFLYRNLDHQNLRYSNLVPLIQDKTEDSILLIISW